MTVKNGTDKQTSKKETRKKNIDRIDKWNATFSYLLLKFFFKLINNHANKEIIFHNPLILQFFEETFLFIPWRRDSFLLPD